ncbi:hypothetical protein [Sphingomicrobium astaxanthinifaciens]|uniref:hypothetical protein n=1 Tax=Sphingomicrobium astaxanthinifaciens TaxID=1227949 RepID=UPI001FCC8D62|nr:hypothetical protein [Sphingomicrobium astaxanthinifaciens]MCJ7421216.1 hypothetical protein [Sphingomicrobium astaxanthinifaciens]
MSWKKRVALGAALIAIGMLAALYGVARWEGGQRMLGLAPPAGEERVAQGLATLPDTSPAPRPPQDAAAAPARRDEGAASAAATEERLAALERAMIRAEGAAGRADGLLLAFAARRAIERGLPLGYLEPLLVDRFGTRHEAAVGTVIAGAREPILLDDLVAGYERLGTVLRGPGPDASAMARVRRALGSLVMVYSANEPNPRPRARYERALVDLRLGNVEGALAEAMRLPGAQDEAARAWIERARRYVAVQRALDRIETAALLNRDNLATN